MCLNNSSRAMSQLKTTVEQLLGVPVETLSPIPRGRNSRLFKVTGSAGNCFALKQYLLQAEDLHDRMSTEFNGLSFLWKNGVRSVPCPVACDRSLNLALYGWIDGEPVENPDETDIDAVLDFIEHLRKLTTRPESIILPQASAACLSAGELVKQVKRRFKPLKKAGEESDELREFLLRDLSPWIERLAEALAREYKQIGLPLNEFVSPEIRILSPSDFGFHNAIKTKTNRIVFVDFEYFGWDDPVKLVADFLLHPGMELSTGLKVRFVEEVKSIFHRDKHFTSRLKVQYPLYLLCWCLILLNEFLPHRWRRRAFAGDANREVTQKRQLVKARRLLQRIEEGVPTV